MRGQRDDSSFSAEERRLLAASIPPIPLNEARIQATLLQAIANRRRRQVRGRLVGAAAITAIATLVAAGYWRWSGRNSDEDLTFGLAMDLTRQTDHYERGRIQAAAGKVYRDAIQVLAELKARGLLTPTMEATVLRSLDSPQRIAIPYSQGFESLRQKLTSGGQLTTDEAEQLTRAICAGIHAIRELGERDTRFTRITDSLVRHLRGELLGQRTDGR